MQSCICFPKPILLATCFAYVSANHGKHSENVQCVGMWSINEKLWIFGLIYSQIRGILSHFLSQVAFRIAYCLNVQDYCSLFFRL